MRMIMAPFGAALLALAGCGDEKPTAAPQGGRVDALQPVAPAPETPAMPAASATAPPATAVVAAPPPVAEAALSPCPVTVASYCSGPLIIRADQAVLSKSGRPGGDGSQDMTAAVRFTVENRSADELLVNVSAGPVYLTLGNGTVLVSRVGGQRASSGISPCHRDLETCVNGQIGEFLKVVPGESPARFQLFFAGRSDSSVRNTLAGIGTADTALDVHFVAPGDPPATVKASFDSIPIRNQLAP